MLPPSMISGSRTGMNEADGATTEPRIRINRPADETARCKVSRVRVQPRDFFQPTQPPITPSTSNAPSHQGLSHAGVARSCRRMISAVNPTNPHQTFNNVTTPPEHPSFLRFEQENRKEGDDDNQEREVAAGPTCL